MKVFHHQSIFPYIDYVLTSKEKQKDLPDILKEKCLFYTDPPTLVVEKLSKAKILYIYPDTFDQWTDILLFIHQKKPLPVKLMIFADSDISLCNDHLDALFAFFGETEFWVQNWLGYHPRCILLPLGTFHPMSSQDFEKKNLFGISFLNHYIGCEPRETFYNFLHQNQQLLPNCFPKTNFDEYCKLVGSSRFHTCPMGEGYDTYRFWETLALGTIPVVKDHIFYESLSHHYPDLPFVRLKNWDSLESTLKSYTVNPIPDLPYLYEEYWINKLNNLL